MKAGGFRLLGAHVPLPCAACHVGPGFDPLFPGVTSDQDCVGCHQDDYDSADPDHAGSGFPTTCTSCHNTDRWDDAIFTEHDALFFPIFSGAHNGKWGSCADCHDVPSDFAAFNCLSCHNQPQMDEKHKEEPGYAYESAACYDCHPNGKSP